MTIILNNAQIMHSIHIQGATTVVFPNIFNPRTTVKKGRYTSMQYSNSSPREKNKYINTLLLAVFLLVLSSSRNITGQKSCVFSVPAPPAHPV